MLIWNNLTSLFLEYHKQYVEKHLDLPTLVMDRYSLTWNLVWQSLKCLPTIVCSMKYQHGVLNLNICWSFLLPRTPPFISCKYIHGILYIYIYIYIYIYKVHSNIPDKPKRTILLELARSFLRAWLVWFALGWCPTLIYFRRRLFLGDFSLLQRCFWGLRSSGICSRLFVTAWLYHLQASYV